MPFKIIKKEGYYRIYKIKEDILTKPRFKTKQKAINQANNWLRYRGGLYPHKYNKHSKIIK